MTDIKKLKEECIEKLQILNDDIPQYLAVCLKIRDKNGNIIPFIANDPQLAVLNLVKEWKKQYPDEKTRPTLFIIILKARQIGFSTVIESLFFHELHFNANKVAMVISYDEPSAQNINDMSDRFYQHLPQYLIRTKDFEFKFRPERRPSRGKGILFENPTNNRAEFEKNPGLQSKFLIETAGNANAGSSFTINYLHISELSKWPDAKTTLTSLLQAVPQYGGIVVIESTAKGIEYFHKLWEEAKRGELNYHTIFVAWHEHIEYTKKFISETERNSFVLTEKEKEIQKLYNLTLEQLNWRRDTIKTKCNNDEDIFFQEYPSSDEEAFLTSGRPVYDRMKVQARIKYLTELYKAKPPDVGYIDFVDGRFKFIPDPRGTVIIYKHPEIGVPYVLGGDTAEGLLNGDWSVSQVCDNTTGEQVAKQRLHIHPDLFAIEQIKLARYYNEALINDEVNNHGHVVISALQRNLYYKQYKREVLDNISRVMVQKFGFDTKEMSRQRIIDRTRAIVRDEINSINDLDTLNEMLTFIYNEQGKEEAESDCFDDCVLAFALMHEARSQQRTYAKEQSKPIDDQKYIHPSILIDSTTNPQLKRYYKKIYGKR
jgi:hypothetical protein